ncbi:MAG: extracellular solute-binding protein [Oscillospiraceae bacterium]|nr:extracellular solute-binding protein [Oscillospiraceae bacterium]
MRRFVSIIAIAFLLTQLAACSDYEINENNSEAPSGKGRTELILATDTNSSSLSSIISSFNKNSENYSIKVVYYNTLEQNIDQLRTAIIAGNPPDIYAFTQNPFVEVKIPIYEDLLPYLDGDPIYGRDTFMPSLFNTITRDGCLYYIPYDFFVNTFTARESIVGVRSGITMEEASEFARDMGSYVNVFPAWMSRETLLAYVVKFSIAKFIDPATGECNFLNPEFIDLLEQCKAHPYSPSESSFGSNLLENSLLQSFTAFIGLHNAYGTDYSFVGFPTEDSNGSTFEINLRFSISAQSQHKDAAWDFVRTVINDENQKNVTFFPSTQSELDRQAEIVLEGDPSKTQIKLEQFEVDRFNSLINSITMISDGTDTTLYNIIKEEAMAFFAGDKTAEEASKLIQSRASLYIEERK